VRLAMLPLHGIKVIEVAQNVAGPGTGQILASLGADVVKLERPDSGDDTRYWASRSLRMRPTLFIP
jgi:crotonobetainyl-CoA:carnitine CoA-transferase CaiB-like acyl-CoA transferase